MGVNFMLATTIPLHPHFIVNEAGNKESVILSMDDYSNLIGEIEDLAAIAERKTEDVFSHSEVIAELKSDGYL